MTRYEVSVNGDMYPSTDLMDSHGLDMIFLCGAHQSVKAASLQTDRTRQSQWSGWRGRAPPAAGDMPSMAAKPLLQPWAAATLIALPEQVVSSFILPIFPL